MPRPRTAPDTKLGVTLVERRGERTLKEAANEAGIEESTFSRAERGVGRPTYETAVKLAAWLGWTTDQVMEAATMPA